LENEEISE